MGQQALASLLDHERFHVRPPQPFEHLVARENLVIPVACDIGICVPTNEEIDVFLRRSAHRRQLSSYSHSPFLAEIFVHDRAVAEHRLGIVKSLRPHFAASPAP